MDDNLADKVVLGVDVFAGMIGGVAILVVSLVLIITVQCCVITRYIRKVRRHHSMEYVASDFPVLEMQGDSLTITADQDYEAIMPNTNPPNQSEHMKLQRNMSYGSNLSLDIPEPEYSSLKLSDFSEPVYDNATCDNSMEGGLCMFSKSNLSLNDDKMTRDGSVAGPSMLSKSNLSLNDDKTSRDGSVARLSMLSKSNDSVHKPTHDNASSHGSVDGLSMLSKSNRSVNLPIHQNTTVRSMSRLTVPSNGKESLSASGVSSKELLSSFAAADNDDDYEPYYY